MSFSTVIFQHWIVKFVGDFLKIQYNDLGKKKHNNFTLLISFKKKCNCHCSSRHLMHDCYYNWLYCLLFIQGDGRTYSYVVGLSSSSADPDWEVLFFLAKTIPRICHNVNRVAFIFGEPVAEPVQVCVFRYAWILIVCGLDSSVVTLLTYKHKDAESMLRIVEWVIFTVAFRKAYLSKKYRIVFYLLDHPPVTHRKQQVGKQKVSVVDKRLRSVHLMAVFSN